MRLSATLALLVGLFSPQVCGSEVLKRPSCDVNSHKIDRVVGYYDSWSIDKDCGTMPLWRIPQGVYSHINIAYAAIHPKTFEVVPSIAVDDDHYNFVKALRSRDIGLQVWLVVGGWTFRDPGGPTAATLSTLAHADITTQNVFFSSLLRFMTTWGFTGVDIDWKYPTGPEDYKNFPKFLKNLKAALDNYGYGLSIPIPLNDTELQHFDLAAIEPYVDWFNVMSGTWNNAVLGAHTNLTEIAQGLDLVWQQKIPASKITLGMAFYSLTATLLGSCNTPGCTYASEGATGRCRRVTGLLASWEIAEIIQREKLTPTLYKDAAVKTITWGKDQWATFDDKDTFKLKGNFSKSQCLGGVAVWSLPFDDRIGTNAKDLADALGNELKVDKAAGITRGGTFLDHTQHASNHENHQDKYCRWVGCGEQCPNGFTQIVRDDKKSEIMMDPGTSRQAGFPNSRVLCCPTSDRPTCRWRGYSDLVRCDGYCHEGEVEMGFTQAGCVSGHQTACCSHTESTAPWGECKWTGCTTEAGKCPDDYPNFVVSTPRDMGGSQTCPPMTTSNYCCKGSSAPKAFTRCGWYATPADGESGVCMDCCPGRMIQIASDILNIGKGADQGHGLSLPYCDTGNKAFCCAGDGDLVLTQDAPSEFIQYQHQNLVESDAHLHKVLAAQVHPADKGDGPGEL